MLTAILIDDKRDDLQLLQDDLVQLCPDMVKIIGVFSSPFDGRKAILELSPDLVFLDVQMPGMDGFELLESLETIDFHLIFTSGYDEYAVKAFRLSAVDYLKKPIKESELLEAVQKVISNQGKFPHENIRALLVNRLGIQKFAIYTSKGYLFYALEELAYFEADGNYSFLIDKDGNRVHNNYSLLTLEDLLPEELFFRPHHQYIVNRTLIKRYVPIKERGRVYMNKNQEIPIAKRRFDDFNIWLLKRLKFN